METSFTINLPVTTLVVEWREHLGDGEIWQTKQETSKLISTTTSVSSTPLLSAAAVITSFQVEELFSE